MGTQAICSHCSGDPRALQRRVKHRPQEGAYESSGCDRQPQTGLHGSEINQALAASWPLGALLHEAP